MRPLEFEFPDGNFRQEQYDCQQNKQGLGIVFSVYIWGKALKNLDGILQVLDSGAVSSGCQKRQSFVQLLIRAFPVGIVFLGLGKGLKRLIDDKRVSLCVAFGEDDSVDTALFDDEITSAEVV